ncbi:MAG: type 1 periplasmic binding fold superfamily protein [Saprospiraceae bacterium]
MNKSTINFLFFSLAATTWTACSVDDDIIVCCFPPELITTVNVDLLSSSSAATLTFQDIDGPGGNDGVTTGATLSANTSYSFTTTFLNESVTPTEDVTVEVREEGTEHFVLYTSGALNFTFALSDLDTDGNPIGLTGTLTTGDAGAGDMQLILRHEPTKTSTGATGGETDIDVTFPITVE